MRQSQLFVHLLGCRAQLLPLPLPLPLLLPLPLPLPLLVPPLLLSLTGRERLRQDREPPQSQPPKAPHSHRLLPLLHLPLHPSPHPLPIPPLAPLLPPLPLLLPPLAPAPPLPSLSVTSSSR